MGARINFVFKDSEPAVGEPAAWVVLYSHWGADTWKYDIANAINHAAKRIAINDTAYSTRMMISYLMSESILEEHGYGLFAINTKDPELYDETVVIDMVNKTVDQVPFSEFIEQAFLTEQAQGRVSLSI
jgi:hypothetical protein